MNNEKWKPVVGYEGLYEVSNFGRINSVKRNSTKGGIRKQKERHGYLAVELCKDGVRKTYDVHRLVAIAFIDNPESLPQVNHKDENRKNNYAENLEWCSCKQNINYGTARARMVETQKKNHRPFICIETGKIYDSQKEFADEVGLSAGFINNVLHGRRNTAQNWHIEFID